MKGIAFEFLRTLLNQSDPISIMVHVTFCVMFLNSLWQQLVFFASQTVGFSEVQ